MPNFCNWVSGTPVNRYLNWTIKNMAKTRAINPTTMVASVENWPQRCLLAKGETKSFFILAISNPESKKATKIV